MPAKSAAQARFMQGIAHGMKPKSGKGPSPAVARKFLGHGRDSAEDYGGWSPTPKPPKRKERLTSGRTGKAVDRLTHRKLPSFEEKS